jgi:DNA-directed RNA polymerase specialized sigma24 family protein
LPERYQQVVTLRYLAQMPFSEIGRLIGVPQATAKTHFQRARPLLRAALQAEHVAELLPVFVSKTQLRSRMLAPRAF